MKFKLREFTKNSHSSFALSIKTGLSCDDDNSKINIVHFAIGKYSWWFDVPQFIKPKFKWVDTSKESWSTNPAGGYMETIHKDYGFSFCEEALHIRYGIQPGNWSRDDKENSDHTKVFFYFWGFDSNVRHDAYDITGNYLCSGKHFGYWKSTWEHKPHLPGNPECDHIWTEEPEETAKCSL